MQQQRTIHVARDETAGNAAETVTVAAFGMSRQAAPGRTVAETLAELGVSPEPFQEVRVGGEEVRDLRARTLRAGETVKLTNRIVGGG